VHHILGSVGAGISGTTSTPRRQRGFSEGAINRKERYPPGCNRRASERMTTAKETHFTNVVRVKGAPWTHDPTGHSSPLMPARRRTLQMSYV
jgi:hypothetical protein